MAGKRIFLGLDMGGTDIKATATDDDGAKLVTSCDKVRSLASEGPRRTLQQLKTAADQALERADATWDQVACLGLDTPGPASLDGLLSKSPNLDHAEWQDFPVRAEFEKLVDRPVVYANDGNAAAYAEYFERFPDDPSKILAAAILGTGLGGALVSGGEVQAGSRGFGAEFGHIRLPTHKLVDPGDSVPVCGCEKEACAEAFVSLTALDYHLRKELSRPENQGHPLLEIPDEGRQRAERLLGLAQEGDELAQKLFDQQAVALGLLFVQLANCFDPDILIIGGGLTESSAAFRERFIKRTDETFRREAFEVQSRDMIIDFAGDEDMAGCRGSALLARYHVQRQER